MDVRSIHPFPKRRFKSEVPSGACSSCFVAAIEVVEMKLVQRRQQLHRQEPPEPGKEANFGATLGGALGIGLAKSISLCSFITLVLLLIVLSGSRGGSSLDLLLSSYRVMKRVAEQPEKGKLVGGLLSAAHDEASCLSRYHFVSYRKPSNHTPSPHLIAKLRRYEALHKKCGPHTDLYRQSVKHLVSNSSGAAGECNYLVWIPTDGLGNRMISITSAFLYALLNDKVLLLDLQHDMDDLFCEPFPQTTWLVPTDFPIEYSWRLERGHRYGQLLKSEQLTNDMDPENATLPSYLYLHLVHFNDNFDKMFYCGEGQRLLRRFQWLLLRSNQYFAPAMFLIPEFEEELGLLFPDKSTVFHHLARYLFHPTDSVWGYIARYYKAYLSNAREKLGIQIREFGNADMETRASYIIDCAITQNLLPNVSLTNSTPPTETMPKSVLITSLKSGYFEKLRSMYYEHATTTGEVVGVYQPSYEERQHTESLNHNKKALAEIFLLSLSDALITTPISTFGYVAQGLGGLRPWLLPRLSGGDHCLRSMSMEPCFHFPPSFDCKTKEKVVEGARVGYLRHCEDFRSGVKLIGWN